MNDGRCQETWTRIERSALLLTSTTIPLGVSMIVVRVKCTLDDKKKASQSIGVVHQLLSSVVNHAIGQRPTINQLCVDI